MTVLRGPSDADHYRVRVGRYGDRWYTDPLPACPIAEASDWQGPSWSIVKGAAGKDWSYVTNKRNGHTPTAELERIAGLAPEMRVTAFNAINKHGLEQAGGRGTIVHLWCEDLLAGLSPRTITPEGLVMLRLPKAALDEAITYLPAIDAFFNHYQPQVIAAEYVALHRTLNGVGYGCTPDVVARIGGKVYGIDWKTRGIDSDHGAYPEEAAQIAAGAMAEYMIVTHPITGEPTRRLLPEIDAGIVVSIRPDGCRIYPIDLQPAWEHVQAMHAFWTARRVEKAAIGKPWPPTPTKETTWTTTSPTSSHTSTENSESSTGPSPTSTNSATPSPASSVNSSEPSTSSPNPPAADDMAYTSITIADAMLGWPVELRQTLKTWWPGGCPTPGQVRKGQAVWTEEQIDQITALCDLGDTPFWENADPKPGMERLTSR